MYANGSSPAVAAPPSTTRSRLPRWTRHETLVLIQAKRAMEQRRLRSPQPPVRLKWTVVSAYCRRHGVERGPMQCRKRWGNLSWDLKKIVAWEKNIAAASAAGGGAAGAGTPEEEEMAAAAPKVESFWDMRGEQRRARQLPSSFDREVYEALVFVGAAAKTPPDMADGDGDDEAEDLTPVMVMPISARMYEPPPASSQQECSDPVTESARKGGAAASDKNSASQQDGGGGGFQDDSEATFGAGVGAEGTASAAAAGMGIRQVVGALERSNRMVAEQLEAQKASWESDREQRGALLACLTRLADAVGKIADKL